MSDEPTIVTRSDLTQFIKRTAKRGRFRVIMDRQGGGLDFGVEVSVPIWRVPAVRELLRERAPVAMPFKVQRLSVVQHFTVWGVSEIVRGLPS